MRNFRRADPILSRLWTKVHDILRRIRRLLVVSNALDRLCISWRDYQRIHLYSVSAMSQKLKWESVQKRHARRESWCSIAFVTILSPFLPLSTFTQFLHALEGLKRSTCRSSATQTSTVNPSFLTPSIRGTLCPSMFASCHLTASRPVWAASSSSSRPRTCFYHRPTAHCLNHLHTAELKPPGAMRLRARGHDFELPTVKYELNKRNFIVRSLFQYVWLCIYRFSLVWLCCDFKDFYWGLLYDFSVMYILFIYCCKHVRLTCV